MFAVLKQRVVQAAISKGTTILHRCGISSPFLPVPAVCLMYIHLDKVMVEGRGVCRFFRDEVNSFAVSGLGIHRQMLQVTCTYADVVGMSNVAAGTVDVFYRIQSCFGAGCKVVITIHVGGSFHSVHVPTAGISLVAAERFLLSQSYDFQLWLDALTDHGHNTDILCRALNRLYVFKPTVSNVLFLFVMRIAVEHHLPNQGTIYLSLTKFYKFSGYHSASIDDLPELLRYIYAAMDAHEHVKQIQWHACDAIWSLARLSVEHKQIMLDSQVIEMCTRAVRVCGASLLPHNTLAYLLASC